VSSWECLHPGSEDVVGTRTDNDGQHGHNSPKMMEAIRGVVPQLNDWPARTAPAGTDGAPEFVVSHTGRPRVMDCLVEGLGCPPGMFGLARDSLSEVGNLGAASVLEVLERTFAKPPAEGAHGLMLAVGPGVSVTAVRGVWHNSV
jgi:predicted naringenin-chalcone synthase